MCDRRALKKYQKISESIIYEWYLIYIKQDSPKHGKYPSHNLQTSRRHFTLLSLFTIQKFSILQLLVTLQSTSITKLNQWNKIPEYCYK